MNIDLGLDGKVAIITGGGVGIGKETARKLALAGAKVVIAARTASKLEAAAEDLRQSTGGEIIAVPTDTTSKESVEALVATAVERFGAVHILVNCAAAPGGLVRNAIEEADEDALMLDLNTKLFGYFRTARPAGAASSMSAALPRVAPKRFQACATRRWCTLPRRCRTKSARMGSPSTSSIPV